MLRRCKGLTLAVALLAAAMVLADPALYWGSTTAVTGVAGAGPDLVGPDGVAAQSGATWLVELLNLDSGEVLFTAPVGSIVGIGSAAPYAVLYATLASVGPQFGCTVGTRVYNSDREATATHWATSSKTTLLSWSTVPSAPATVTYDAGRVAQGDWREIDNRLSGGSYTTVLGSTAQIVMPFRLAVDHDLSAISFVVRFDPTLLRVVDYRSAGRTAVAVHPGGIDQASGRIAFVFGEVGAAAAIATGLGPVAEAVFELQPGLAAAAISPLAFEEVHAWTTSSLGKTLSTYDGSIEIAESFTHTLTYLAGEHGSVVGPTPQTVDHRASGAAVRAVPGYGYVFERWSDGSAANPRTDTQVTTSLRVTAEFRSAGAVAASGPFLAMVDASPPFGTHRGLWDLTGSYTATVAGNPLVLSMVHDPKGRLTGTATYSFGRAAPIGMPLKGTFRGARACITMRGSASGVDPAQASAVALTLNLVMDPAELHLVGRVSGSLWNAGVSELVRADMALPLQPPMDGTWTLQFHLEPSARKVTGTALLRLSDGVTYTFAVQGRKSGPQVLLSLAAAPTDPSAKAIWMRTSAVPLEGGWAVLDEFAGQGFGQTLLW